MKKIMVFQHVAYEILGTLNPLLKDAGFRIKYVNFGRHPQMEPSLEGYDGLIILGGPMNVDQHHQHPHLSYEVRVIKHAIKKDIPILGICLGAQLIAKALGARVYPNTEKEIGWYPLSLTEAGKKDPVLGSFQETEKIFQWHGDTFEIPESAILLASSPLCTHQAFRYQDKIYALQFHLEVDQAMIERWLNVPAHKEEIKSLGGKVDVEKIRQQTSLNIERLKILSEQSFSSFVRLFGTTKKYQRLPSR